MQRLLFGYRRLMIPIPWALFTRILPREARKTAARLADLSAEQRRVHHFVVAELPRVAAPVSPEHVAEALAMKPPAVVKVFDELERRLIFLYRSGGRDVVWAYPVTAEPTPHRLAFSSGERLWAA